jgi:predicted DNA-binding protein (MmcQ/YjbR family)
MNNLIPSEQVETMDNLVDDTFGDLLEAPTNLALEDVSDGDVGEESYEHAGIVEFVRGNYNRSRDSRYSDEIRWLNCYRNFRGIYGPEVTFTDNEKSQAFIKITKTKVLAAYAQIVDVLFSTNKFPIGVQASTKPIGIEKAVHIDPKAPPKAPEEDSPASRARPSMKRLGALQSRLEPLKDHLKSGVGLTPTAATFEPAKDTAKGMEDLMHSQLEEADASKGIRSLVYELALFGTGVFKGPFKVNKEYPRWSTEGEYDPEIKIIPDIESVSIWDCYPDPDATTDPEWFIQRHKMSRTNLIGLKTHPYFRENSIDNAIALGPHWIKEHWENVLDDNKVDEDVQRWEVLEYWGIINKELILDEQMDLFDDDLKKKLEDADEVQVNIWVCGDKVIRFLINPFKPMRIPYFVVPYEINPYSTFGIGVAENMLDTQLIMNGFIRLAVDNAALSSNLIFEVDVDALAPGEDFKMYPGKMFKRQSGAPGQAIHSHKINSVTQECLMMFDKARQLSDEATGMPSYAHGQGGVQGIGRTASGMSMLMGAAALNIKAVVKNIDDYLLSPLGKALFAFNMQFNFKEEYAIGSLNVVAKGTESLMRNEVRSQKLMQLYQASMNPMAAPFLKIDYMLREMAISLDLDPDLTVNDTRAAAEQALILGQMGQSMAPPPPPGQQGPEGGPPPVSNPTGQGNGNIAPGAAPGPQEAGFSGTPNAGPQAQPPQG